VDSTHDPVAKGLVERFHWKLRAVIMCHADQQWTEALPLALLGIRMAFKEDLQASVAELMYSELLSIPGKLLTPTCYFCLTLVTYISQFVSIFLSVNFPYFEKIKVGL
jgi:hypothetical protein